MNAVKNYNSLVYIQKLKEFVEKLNGSNKPIKRIIFIDDNNMYKEIPKDRLEKLKQNNLVASETQYFVQLVNDILKNIILKGFNRQGVRRQIKFVARSSIAHLNIAKDIAFYMKNNKIFEVQDSNEISFPKTGSFIKCKNDESNILKVFFRQPTPEDDELKTKCTSFFTRQAFDATFKKSIECNYEDIVFNKLIDLVNSKGKHFNNSVNINKTLKV